MGGDKLALEGMRFFGHHGDVDAERELGSHVYVDVELTADLSAAGRSDVLGDTLETRAMAGYYVAAEPPPTPAEVRRHLLERVPEYLVPTFLIPIPAIPLTSNGKIDRGALPPPRRGSTRG